MFFYYICLNKFFSADTESEIQILSLKWVHYSIAECEKRTIDRLAEINFNSRERQEIRSNFLNFLRSVTNE